MKRLREKLNSQRGASILLALLFFLLCIMVAASILAAAVSNAGKIRSNYEEQQKYLALSSALRLVSSQLEQAEYTGKYTVSTWTEQFPDEEDPAIQHEITYYQVKQIPGEFTCGKLNGDTLSFVKELDGLFAGKFTGTGYKALSGTDVAPLSPDSSSFSDPPKQTLTLTVDGDGLDALKALPVKVEIKLYQSLRIHLKATLTEPSAGDTSYIMEAELTAEGTPTLDFSPGSAIPSSSKPSGTPGAAVISEPPDEERSSPTPVKWKLAWISKEVEGE